MSEITTTIDGAPFGSMVAAAVARMRASGTKHPAPRYDCSLCDDNAWIPVGPDSQNIVMPCEVCNPDLWTQWDAGQDISRVPRRTRSAHTAPRETSRYRGSGEGPSIDYAAVEREKRKDLF